MFLIWSLMSLFLTSLLTFFHFMFISRYKKKNIALFNSMSNVDFKNLIYIDLFIDKKYYPDFLKNIGIEKRDMYAKEFGELILTSCIPMVQLLMLVYVFCFICRLFFTNKNLSELYTQVNKNTDTTEAMIDSIVQFNLLKKYLNSKKYNDKDISNVISTVYNKSHPYKQLINDNFTKLLDLITKKEEKLNVTLSECKKEIIKSDIESMIIKFINLTNNINENLVEKEMIDLSNKYSELINISKSLKEKESNIDDVLSKYKNKEVSINEVEKEIEFLIKYIDEKDKINLKKLLSNTELSYYNSIVNLLNSIFACVANLELKKQYVTSDSRVKINRKIEYSILEYIYIVTTLDGLIASPADKDVLEYNNLLDEVISDIKTKKGIF